MKRQATGARHPAPVGQHRPDRVMRVIGLRFAAALEQQPAEAGCCYSFVTPVGALAQMGPQWAVDLQAAVEDWSEAATLVVDASVAPGYALKAVELGLKRLSLPPDHPARDDLSAYANRYGARLSTQAEPVQETWHPVLPQRKQKAALISATTAPD